MTRSLLTGTLISMACTVLATASSVNHPFSLQSAAGGELAQSSVDASGTLTSLSITVDFDGANGHAKNLQLGIVAPNGNAIELGGISAAPGMPLDGQDGVTFDNAGVYPDTWFSPNAGTYTHGPIDVSSFGLGGTGEYRVYVMNGFGLAGPATWTGTVTLTGVTPAHFNWVGATSDWATDANWDAGCVPPSGSDVNFPTSAASTTVDLGGTRVVNALLFEGPGYQLTGGALVPNYLHIIGNGMTSTIDSNVELVDTTSCNIPVGSSLVINGDISGTGALQMHGGGVVTLNGDGQFTGDLIVQGGTLALGSATAAANSTLRAEFGSVDILVDTALGGLAGTRDIDFGDRHVTIGGNDADTTYDAQLEGTGTLTKIGNGTLTLVDPNWDLTGDVFLTAGTITGSADAVGSAVVHFEGGGLESFEQDIFVGGLAGSGDFVANGKRIGILSNGDSTYSGSIIGAGNSHLDSSGTLTLTSASSFDELNVFTGVVMLQGPDAAIEGDMYLEHGSLAGSGTVTGNVLMHDDLDPIGVLQIGSLESVSGKLEIELDGATPGVEHDQLVVVGNAELDAGHDPRLAITYGDSGFVAQPGDTFDVLTAGSVQGAFNIVTFPDGQDWYIEYHADRVTIGITSSCDSDFDNDGIVGFGDLTALLNAWGSCPVGPACPWDVNGDDVVGFSDLTSLLQAWGGCP